MPSEPIQTETREESQPAPTVVRAENKKSMIIGSLCFLAYMGCHIGKNNLGALMPQILDAMPDAAATLGSMTSVFLQPYGLGQLITGVIAPQGGKIYLKDRSVAGFDPHSFITDGVSHVPEDRNAQGLVGDMSIAEN